MRALLAQIREHGSPIDALPTLPRFDRFLEFIGLPEIHELEHRFADADETTKETR
jgi:hypothetical protein